MQHSDSQYRSYLLQNRPAQDGAAHWVVYEVTDYVVDGDADTETVAWDQHSGREAVDFMLALCGGFDGMTIFRFPASSPACP